MDERIGVDVVEEAAAELRSVADALTNPLQLRVIGELRMRPGQGAEELAEALDEPVRRIRGQLKVLTDAGLLRVDREEKRRNVAKRFFSLEPTAVQLSAEDDAGLPDGVRARITASVLQAVIVDITASLEDGIIHRRPERHFVRMPARVDERGWEELAAIFEGAWEEAERVGIESARRLAESGERGIATTGVLLLFETPNNGLKLPE